MKVNGTICKRLIYEVKNMVKEGNFGQMVHIMKDIGLIIVNMEKAEC